MIDFIYLTLIIVCLIFGIFFTLVSAVGVIRLPDVYSRAHTVSQTDTLGVGLALAGVAFAAIALGWGSPTVKIILLLFFIFITNPTAAHAIARAASEQDIIPWREDDDRKDTELADRTTSDDTGHDVSRSDSQDTNK